MGGENDAFDQNRIETELKMFWNEKSLFVSCKNAGFDQMQRNNKTEK